MPVQVKIASVSLRLRQHARNVLGALFCLQDGDSHEPNEKHVVHRAAGGRPFGNCHAFSTCRPSAEGIATGGRIRFPAGFAELGVDQQARVGFVEFFAESGVSLRGKGQGLLHLRSKRNGGILHERGELDAGRLEFRFALLGQFERRLQVRVCLRRIGFGLAAQFGFFRGSAGRRLAFVSRCHQLRAQLLQLGCKCGFRILRHGRRDESVGFEIWFTQSAVKPSGRVQRELQGVKRITLCAEVFMHGSIPGLPKVVEYLCRLAAQRVSLFQKSNRCEQIHFGTLLFWKPTRGSDRLHRHCLGKLTQTHQGEARLIKAEPLRLRRELEQQRIVSG